MNSTKDAIHVTLLIFVNVS